MASRLSRYLRWAIATVLTALHLPALAASESDLWFDPADPGWGLAVHRQGDVVFAVLFTYGADSKPTWYVASDVRDTGTHLDPIGVPVYGGKLYSTTGPAFSQAFDSTAVRVTEAGSIELAHMFDNVLSVRLTVGSQTVVRTLQRQTWADNSPALAGEWSGTFVKRLGVVNSCAYEPVPQQSLRIRASAGARLAIDFTGSAQAPVCSADAGYDQEGTHGRVTGTFACRAANDPAQVVDTGAFTIRDLTPNGLGFSGSLVLNQGLCSNVQGTLAFASEGVRNTLRRWPQGDLWFDAAHPGWGLTVHRQAGVTFAVAFVYGSDGKATWYVASDVRAAGVFFDPNGTEDLRGTLYTTTGAPFGSPPGTARMSAAPVGTIALAHLRENSLSASLRIGDNVVSNGLTRQTWRDQLGAVLGDWTGTFASHREPCAGQLAQRQALAIRLRVDGKTTVTFAGPPRADTCLATADYAQQGSLGELSGTYECRLRGQALSTPPVDAGTFVLSQIVVNALGLTARLRLDDARCVDGTVAAASAARADF